MAAQSYDEPPRPAAQSYDEPPRRAAQPGPREPYREAAPREPQQGRRASRAAGERETRSQSNQETMIADRPRRARGRGSGGPGGPEEPPTRGGGGDKPKWRRFLPNWKIVMVAMAVLAAGIFGMIAVAYANTPMPTENQTQAEALAQSSTIYYSDGKKKIATLGTPRKIVQFDQMSQFVKDAAVAIENKTFYEDSGISISGMVRSLWSTATGQQLQGASTITQQMARNYFQGLSQEISIKRKINEIFVAVKLDKQMTKEDILKTYLNTVNFGRAYGIEAASQAYFGVSAAKLNESQAAYLAARIQTPAWDADAPALQDRWKTVVKYMSEQWPDKYGQLPNTATFPKTKKASDANVYGGLKGYMIKAVLNELKERRGLTEDMIKSGGYQIISTFDKRLMLAAKTAVLSTTSSLSKEFHTGLAAVDPKNGRVVAFYGGTDYLKDPWNEAFDSAKQAASAFKPYVLAAWLQAGYSLKSYVPGRETVPKELPGQQAGGFKNSHNEAASIDVIKATADSVNTAYVSMAYALPGKIEDVQNLVKAAGFSETRMDKDVDVHSYQFAIGSAPVTPVEQASGYSIFANGGKYTKYHVVREVRQNKVVKYPEQLVAKKVVDPDVAADATVAMQEVLRSGTARGKGLGNRPAAGKTGTNNDEKEAWFVGYTPQYSVAVGMYREVCKTKKNTVVPPINSNCPITPKGRPQDKKYNINKPYTLPYETTLGFEGADAPTATWRAFMLAAHEGKPVEQFPTRVDLGQPENIVPSPTPTIKPTEDPSFQNEDPNQDPTQECLVAPCDDGNVSVDPNDNPIDDQGNIPTGDDSQVARGDEGPASGRPTVTPGPMPGRREQR
ncbi:transglycosylase domain-containing protein [Nonomuraea sp. NPDC005983]|uniref:transglycosylase domain-containing protein n=1 Tax=Nonomuraea sp. NPDC005983 TaxID=3155595 RepID=UPI0033AA64AB